MLYPYIFFRRDNSVGIKTIDDRVVLNKDPLFVVSVDKNRVQTSNKFAYVIHPDGIGWLEIVYLKPDEAP